MKTPNLQTKIIEFSTLDSQCAYLDEKSTRMSYKAIKNCSFTLNSELVKRGWRRFGIYYSRPQCKGCEDCLSIRIDANEYKFSKSAKRCFKKNKNTKVIIQTPSVSRRHLELYDKYHTQMSIKKGWKYNDMSPLSYYELYVAGHEEFGKEVLYFVDDLLVGVDLIDFTDDGISSIYFFYDPEFAYLSLGRFSLYQQILLARSCNLRWIYIGYYVEKCPSLSYKDEYKPYEVLQNLPDIDEKVAWK